MIGAAIGLVSGVVSAIKDTGIGSAIGNVARSAFGGGKSKSKAGNMGTYVPPILTAEQRAYSTRKKIEKMGGGASQGGQQPYGSNQTASSYDPYTDPKNPYGANYEGAGKPTGSGVLQQQVFPGVSLGLVVAGGLLVYLLTKK